MYNVHFLLHGYNKNKIKYFTIFTFSLERRPAVASEREQSGRVDPRPGRRHPQGHHQRQQRCTPRHGRKFFFYC